MRQSIVIYVDRHVPRTRAFLIVRWLVGVIAIVALPVLCAPSLGAQPVATAAVATAANESGLPAILSGAGTRLRPILDAAPAEPKPLAVFSASALNLRDSVVALVRAQLGKRYVYGGSTPEHGFDCSGLVRYVMGALHIALPRTAKEQARAGAIVPRDSTRLQPGDLVTFGVGKKISHIGIYVGDGHFVQASSAAGRVIESRLDRPIVRRVKPWRGARRVIDSDSTDVDLPDLVTPTDSLPAVAPATDGVAGNN
jgi:cell wall-associated NlpC family hydrolase